MFRRQLARQSRTLSSSLSSLPSAQRSSFSSFSPIAYRPAAAASSIPSRLPARRWQSTDGSNGDKKADGAAPTEGNKASEENVAQNEDPTKAELEKAKKEIIDLKDKYLRSVADYRNLQDRMKREQDATRQFAIQRFATDLLDSIDNFDRALTSVPAAALDQSAAGQAPAESAEPNKDLVNLFSGLKMTEEILMNTLKKHGLERFDPMEGEGRKFDPNTDEATFFTKVEGKNDGDVFFTQSKGFKLNGRVVRAAKVGVVKNS